MKTPKEIEEELKENWGSCIYCGRNMSKAFHRPMICGEKECQIKADETIKKMYENGDLK